LSEAHERAALVHLYRQGDLLLAGGHGPSFRRTIVSANYQSLGGATALELRGGVVRFASQCFI
jgi:hypothetical protein